MTIASTESRIRGGIFGLLIGDALGVPYEFNSPESIPSINEIEFTPPLGFHRSHSSVPPGTWSDDGAHALLLLASLLKHNQLDLDDLAQRLVQWFESGYMAVDNHVFDVGIQTRKAIGALQRGTAPHSAGPADVNANGNGSLMRVLPLALWHQGTDAELVQDAHTQSQITHGHPRAQICCALYCLWARRTLAAEPDPWASAVATLRSLYNENSQESIELEQHICPDEHPQIKGTGYVVDCLHSARWALKAGDYEQVVKAAISLGNDTDTTACVAGGIAGIRDGIEAIPVRWRSELRGIELIEPLLSKLLARNN
jgi:ADP-ribosyl-[dinitrogen reductase] hydrolase